MNYSILAIICPALALVPFWLLLSLIANRVEPVHDAREPPIVKPRLPLVGHLWGLYRHGPKYFQRTNPGNRLPIHTLKVLSGNIYVVTSPSIVNMVSKNTKYISFNPLIAEVGIRLTHASKEARTIIERNIDGTDGKDSYVIEIHDRTVEALTLGPEMQRLTLVVLRKAWNEVFIPLQASAKSKESNIPLYAFIRHMLTQTSTTAYYGPLNPLRKDQGLEQAFWDYNADMNMLLLDVCPEFIARKGHKARTRIAQGFKAFLDANPVGRSSYLAESRYIIGKKHGMDEMDIARLEVGTLIGILVNTVPTLFYMLCHVFKDPQLLSEIRQEIEHTAIVWGREGHGKPVLNVADVRDSCPLLRSTLQETLRRYSEGASARLVCEDTTIDGYLLKKGSMLQMPNSVVHRDPSVWGDASFDARRFLKQGHKPSSLSTTAAGSYRPFGGGSTLCPGRHFATSEILGLAATFIWRFDMEPAHSQRWVLPVPKQASAVEAVFPPSHDIDVVVRRRAMQATFEGDLGFGFE